MAEPKLRTVRNFHEYLFLGAAFIATVLLPFSFFTSFVPMTHGFGRSFLWHGSAAAASGTTQTSSSSFMALNGFGWFFYAFHLLFEIVANFSQNSGDVFISFASFLCGLFALTLILSSLFEVNLIKSKSASPSQNAVLQKRITLSKEVLDHNRENPSGLWWVLISLQVFVCLFGSWFLVLLALVTKHQYPKLELLTTFLSLSCFLGSTPLTHAIGGRWKHASFRKTFSMYQPFKGGASFVALQGIGWTCYGFTVLLGLISMMTSTESAHRSAILFITAVLGLSAEFLIAISLFFFKENENEQHIHDIKKNDLSRKALNVLFAFSNFCFCSSLDWKTNLRKTELKMKDEWKKGEKKFQEIIIKQDASSATGKKYLIVGCGFLGKRIVQRLLQRGEKNVVIFDLCPVNPFVENKSVKYIVGDVTQKEQISNALRDVEVVYATFALIRFMDRLEHQAALSYHVNVRGTKTLINCIKSESLKRGNHIQVIITSSSHATTDEHSMPRFKRTEDSPFVTKETAHNHYGWTKALADEMALKEGSTQDGNVLTTVVRPCSGVFGGDDRTSVQKVLSMGVAPGIGATSKMDWIFVENVVLGHLLAERCLERERNCELASGTISSQAFNVSSNDPVTFVDFWHLVRQIIEISGVKDLNLDFVFVPMSLIWGCAFLSEGVQRLFKGKFSLGNDIDSLTPAMLSTATMSYTYNSDKATKVLGYEPAFTLEQGIQKSIVEYSHLQTDS